MMFPLVQVDQKVSDQVCDVSVCVCSGKGTVCGGMDQIIMCTKSLGETEAAEVIGPCFVRKPQINETQQHHSLFFKLKSAGRTIRRQNSDFVLHNDLPHLPGVPSALSQP